jgi:hypothetical protein
MSDISKQGRAPRDERAGTRLSSQAYPIQIQWPEGKDTQIVCGFADPKTGVFQGGGEYSEIFFTNPDPPLMSMPLPAWQRIQQRSVLHTWEMVEHASNTVYSVPLERLATEGVIYRTREGQRIGVPATIVDHRDKDGVPFTKAQPAARQLTFGEVDPAQFMAPKRRSRPR